ncbi:MAG TPA: ectoine/hydroxyectoine ABC transporter substrate-binding protein EhuB [Pseudonocardiaceae bacterium]|jgi:polar amino acid transport system substrate-binding protein|nr:ectoine/hydroxyectoine ABC transporter substrate-binding protein EhuB [Pseudonocardiaceae bacterium]
MASGSWTRRDFFRRSAAITVLAFGGPVVVGGCTSTSNTTGSTLDAAKQNKLIKVGIAGEQPYGFTDGSGKLTGEAPEVARAVFRNLGIDNVQATQVNFDALIPGLNAKQFDMVAAGMNITSKRCGSAAFSIPDYSALTALLVPGGNPQQVNRLEDVVAKNVQLAVLSGAVEKGFATAAGVPEGQIQSFAAQDDMLRAVADNRVYCAALTDISLKDLVKKNPGSPVEVTKGFVPVVNGKEQISAGGFVFRKDDTALLNAFNDQLKKLHDSGEWLKIVEPFGFTQDNVPKSDVTTDKLCAAS